MKLPTLVLDLDDSIRRLPNENRLRPATHWREQVRFGCSIKHFRQFWAETEKTLPHRAIWHCVNRQRRLSSLGLLP